VKSEKLKHTQGCQFDSSDGYSSDSSINKKICETGKKYQSLKKFVYGFKLNFHFGMLLAFHFLLFTLMTSCSQNFEPFQENNRFNFTIYGYLDATADTQWVRVSPVRGDFEMAPVIPDMKVTLENRGNGHSEVMNDSLFDFRQGFNALNVWTEMNIEPEQTYRLRAETPGGDYSEVTVTTPADYPTPRLFIERIPEQDPKYFLWIADVEKLADVQSRWFIRLYTPYWEEKRMVVISLKDDAVLESRGSYTVQMFPDEEKQQIINQSFVLAHPESEVEFLHHQLFVAAGGPEWNDDFAEIDDLVYSLPDGFSNVENGLGYMVGIVSKLFPFESCRDENRELIGCPEEKTYW